MIYLTYNDPPSGIYSSQVIDVCKFLNSQLNSKVRLVSLLSIRGFLANRRKIKSFLPSAIVLPMFPGPQNWQWNTVTLFFLFLFQGKQKVIARGPYAASLALSLKKGMVSSVCFDARGASVAEEKEYNVSQDDSLHNSIFEIEKNAVLNSDNHMAVSNELVNYWRENFRYNGTSHVVIPCTLDSKYVNEEKEQISVAKLRTSLGFSPEDIIVVYSGSSAGWQSMNKVDVYLYALMSSQQNVKALFLTNADLKDLKITGDFPKRVQQKWVREEEVKGLLQACDYGILIRERSVTNQVSSPVKFAEYLSCGLKVLISEGIGDYTMFTKENNCGLVISDNDAVIPLADVSVREKEMLRQLALNSFSKNAYIEQYKKIATE